MQWIQTDSTPHQTKSKCFWPLSTFHPLGKGSSGGRGSGSALRLLPWRGGTHADFQCYVGFLLQRRNPTCGFGRWSWRKLPSSKSTASRLPSCDLQRFRKIKQEVKEIARVTLSRAYQGNRKEHEDFSRTSVYTRGRTERAPTRTVYMQYNAERGEFSKCLAYVLIYFDYACWFWLYSPLRLHPLGSWLRNP